jgi:hypothetical protein
MALEETLVSLTSIAGRTLVAAAVTDAWGTAKRGFVRLLGRGDPRQTELAQQRLEQARAQLASVPAAGLEQVRNRLEAVWQARLQDVLDEHPETAIDLKALVEQIQAQLPSGVVSAANHGLAVGGDVTITASGGGVAALTIHGNVVPGNPTSPGPANH